jgi:hypothetical protein
MASGTGLYDLSRRDWDGELTELFGLTNGQLGSLGDETGIEFHNDFSRDRRRRRRQPRLRRHPSRAGSQSILGPAPQCARSRHPARACPSASFNSRSIASAICLAER